MIELLVVLVIILVISLLTWPAIQRMIERSKLQAITSETLMLMQRARLESIKRGVPAVVLLDLTDREVFAFVDVNDALGDPVSDRLFNPIGGRPYRSTDYELGTLDLPNVVRFGGPVGASGTLPDPVTGFATTDGTDGRAVFTPDGSAELEGAFRFGVTSNHIEVRVAAAATGKMELRKYRIDGFRGEGYYEHRNDPATDEPLWTWY
jgi:type II secretory pathway pseudopilin PulG